MALLNHVIRPQQQRRRDAQAERVSGLTSEQYATAVAEQKTTSEKFAATLVRLGFMTEAPAILETPC